MQTKNRNDLPGAPCLKNNAKKKGRLITKRISLTSNIFNKALTYIFLSPNEAPNEARPITKLTKTKRGAKNIVIKTNGVRLLKLFNCITCLFFLFTFIQLIKIIKIFFFSKILIIKQK